MNQVQDKDIIAKWKTEARVGSPDFSEAMFEYCIAELQHIAIGRKFDPHSPITRGAVIVFEGRVVKSDSAVPEEVRIKLQDAVRTLEDVPDAQKDWHPGSDGQVLDLVHPSLFPLVYGKTRVLPVGSKVVTLADCIERSGEGDVIPIPEATGTGTANRPRMYRKYEPFSTKFQWLPCEVDISGDKPK